MQVKEIMPETLAEWQQQGEDFTLIDIRSFPEMQGGMIPQGLPQPMVSIPHELDRYSRDRTIVVYCRSGIRSYQVCDFMQQQGYTSVLNLSGGIMEWHGKGYEMIVPSEGDLQTCVS